MPTSFTIVGVTFYIYGLIVGLAMIVATSIAEKQWKRVHSTTEVFWRIATWTLLSGIVGARLWHVFTDWQLYVDNPLGAFAIWNGGLSIIGALIGGAVGLAISAKKENVSAILVADAICVGIPFGQAIGRLGNWFNQELYGYPTDLPWKLYIEPAHRLPQFKSQAYYHPLFAYEVLLMLLVGVVLWKVSHTPKYSLGTGICTILYIASYSWIRFLLEFLRIDKALIGTTGWGVNQVVMGVVAVASTLVLLALAKKDNNNEKK